MRRPTLLLTLVFTLFSCGKGSDEATPSGSPKADEGGAAQSADGATADALPEAEAILQKAVEAFGGRDKLDAVKSYYYEGTIRVERKGITGHIKIWWQEGDFFTTQHMVGVGEIRAGKSGDTVWSEDPINKLRKLKGIEAEQHLWASSLFLAADWKRYFIKAETVAARQVEGDTVHDVKLTSESGAEALLSFSEKTGLHVAQKFEQHTPMGKIPVAIELRDHREVGGIVLAHESITDAFLAEAVQTIDKLEINAEVDATKFAMPTGGAELVKKPGKAVPKADK